MDVTNLPNLPLALIVGIGVGMSLVAAFWLTTPPVAVKEEPKLTKCDDCGHAISRRAVMCPNCGREMEED